MSSSSHSHSAPTFHHIHLHPAQQEIAGAPERFRVVACGRRFGKTTVGLRAVFHHAQHGMECWWVAPTYGNALQVWRALCAEADPAGAAISQTERALDFPGGGALFVRSARSLHSLRGAGLDFLVVDEAAHLPATLWEDILRPMLADRRGGALLLSTPNGLNWFHECFVRGQDPAEHEWRSFHFSSYDNPRIARTELETLRRHTRDATFRREYLAEFLPGEAGVFREPARAATAPAGATPQVKGHYVAGIDWGRSQDYTAVVVLEIPAKSRDGAARGSVAPPTMVALERFRELSWSLQRSRILALCERWRPAVLLAEANSIGEPNLEAVQGDGLPIRPFHTTARSKGPLIEALALALERDDLRLQPEPILLAELSAYQQERLPLGGYRYSAPAGAHDDTVMALALAWRACGQEATVHFW